MRIALDIETACAVEGCTDGACKHALDARRNRITVIGCYYLRDRIPTSQVFRDLESFNAFVRGFGAAHWCGHNLKFDLHTLKVKGVHIESAWCDDSMLMAASSVTKVPEHYLKWYGEERKRRKATGEEHRNAGPLSLKTLAPYFLGVEPFWETSDHDNDEYVTKDARYAFELVEFFEKKLKEEGAYAFYRGKFLPWTKLLLRMEHRGILLDLVGMEKADEEARQVAEEAKHRLDELWASAYLKYLDIRRGELHSKYWEMEAKAVEKSKSPAEKAPTIRARYSRLFEEASEKIEQLNLDSPAQLTWLLRDYLKLNIADFDGDETTGKAVLQRLAGQGREDIVEFLRYRKARKLTTAFFPSYRELHINGAIHCTFNPTGARTGRLSSSRPNLQQIERGIKKLFVARPGYKFCIRDESAIEPRLIAFLTHDLNLCDIVIQGKDFHNYNTGIFFDLDANEEGFKKTYPLQREVGKEVGLSLLYGSGSNRLQESAQKRGFVWTKKEAQYKVDRFKEFYEGVYKFREQKINQALLHGPVSNILGRQFIIEDPADIHMKGLNTWVQGGASDIVIHSAMKAQDEYDELGIDAHVLVLEHDCIIVEAAEAVAGKADLILNRCMTCYKLPTPFGLIPLATEGGISSCWEK